MHIFVNGRFRSHKITGVQRVAHEITARLGSAVTVCQPKEKLQGWKGHLWEQTVLPFESRGGVLWSPCAAGPIAAPNHVVTFHDLFPLDSPAWYGKAYAGWYRASMQRLATTAAHIIAVSEYTKARLIQRLGVLASKITVIHNGVDRKLFEAEPEVALAASSFLRLPSPSYLLCVGSLEPRKNLARLMAAWQRVAPELPPDLWLVVAGAGDKNVYKESCLEQLPARVFFTGYVPDGQMKGLYAGSTGFVFPSLAEGFGLPPLEAMACGVPVLTSRATSLPEVCSSAALYLDPTDVSDMSRAIKLLVSDASLRERLSVLGREQAARFTWERAAERTLSVLRNVIQ
jgi:glycosyltransferase involved in cell wall biosynthesis